MKTGHVSCRMCLDTAHSPPEQGGGEQALYITAVRVLWCGCSSLCPITDSNSIDYRGTKVQPQLPVAFIKAQAKQRQKVSLSSQTLLKSLDP